MKILKAELDLYFYKDEDGTISVSANKYEKSKTGIWGEGEIMELIPIVDLDNLKFEDLEPTKITLIIEK